jgi:hypothetical protein
VRGKKENSIKAAEMRFLRAVKGCTCTREQRIRNERIRDELQIYSIKDKLDETRTKCTEHISRMEEDRLQKAIINYTP